MSTTTYFVLADLILVTHFLVVSFVVLGFMLIVFGKIANWRWIYNSAFRWIHVLTIVLVAGQALLGQLCPLTVWENALRIKGGQTAYQESFVQHWLHSILYFDAPFWVFTTIYTAFAVVVVLMWSRDRTRLPERDN